MSVLELKPIAAHDNEQPALSKIKEVLNDDKHVPRLIGPNGDCIELPVSVFEVLKQIIYHMMRGRAIFIVPDYKKLSTQEAADILGVSRPHVIKLLEEKKIPFIHVGAHRRIRFDDLMKYKRQRDAEREQILDEIAQMSQDLGLY